jgi:hypothetical protein
VLAPRDRQIGERVFQRRHKVARVVEDTRVGVDLEGDGKVMVGMVAQPRDMARDPAAVADERQADRDEGYPARRASP